MAVTCRCSGEIGEQREVGRRVAIISLVSSSSPVATIPLTREPITCYERHMTSDPRAKWLRSVPIFAGLSDAAIERIVDVATELEVARSHVLVQPDEPGAGLFIIEKGSAIVELKNGRVEIGEGECFGELALLDEGAVHIGRVYAASPLRCIAISRNDFDRLLDEEPAIARSLLRVLARRLAQATSS